MCNRINRVSNSEDKGICDFNASIVFTAIVVTRVDRNFNLINSWQTLFLAIFAILCFFYVESRIFSRKSLQLQKFIRSFFLERILKARGSASKRNVCTYTHTPCHMYMPILNPTLVTKSLKIAHDA